MTEIWLPVHGYEGIYSVSDAGRIRSEQRTVKQGGRDRRVQERILKGAPSPSGHLQVHLSGNGQSHTYLVHRLVLNAFVGPSPDGTEGCHGNGDPSDNRLVNLRWDTRSSNVMDAVRHGTYRNVMREKTHCKRGHALSGDNVYTPPNGTTRHCRECRKMQPSLHARKHYADGKPGVRIVVGELA